MTRKQRKIERKHPQKQLTEEEIKFLKNIARLITAIPQKYEHAKFHCPICQMSYCNNFAGGITFCKDCHWGGHGCIREIKAFQICRRCA